MTFTWFDIYHDEQENAHMVKYILYVEKEKFLRSLFEAALRAKKQYIHTVDTLQNNTYLLDDLSPALIILDWETVGTSAELSTVLDFKKSHATTKLLVTCSSEQKNEIPFAVDGIITKPIEVNQLAHKIIGLID